MTSVFWGGEGIRVVGADIKEAERTNSKVSAKQEDKSSPKRGAEQGSKEDFTDRNM